MLIVLQAMDAGGKDGTISHVMRAMNPQGVSVARFEAPTPEEQAHDFLWRVHIKAPRRSQVGVFNRSHYEEVLITRVHKLIDKETCKSRYAQIRDFESELLENGTHILKFFLHISKEEQLARFAQRLEDPQRNWKISEADYTEREFWDDYMDAYEEAMSATSTKHAPWFVIPSNHKWFRNLAISQIVARNDGGFRHGISEAQCRSRQNPPRLPHGGRGGGWEEEAEELTAQSRLIAWRGDARQQHGQHAGQENTVERSRAAD